MCLTTPSIKYHFNSRPVRVSFIWQVVFTLRSAYCVPRTSKYILSVTLSNRIFSLHVTCSIVFRLSLWSVISAKSGFNVCVMVALTVACCRASSVCFCELLHNYVRGLKWEKLLVKAHVIASFRVCFNWCLLILRVLIFKFDNNLGFCVLVGLKC